MNISTNLGGRTGGGMRLLLGIGLAIFALFSYFASQVYNPVTGTKQYLSLTPDQEIALGLRAAPEMAQEFGGLYQDSATQAAIDKIGNRLVTNSIARETPWQFDFHVLADQQTVNAFALPGGQVFITRGLLERLPSENEVAGVLSHEIVHVLARHGAQQMAKSELTNGLIGAVGVASGSADAAQMAAAIGQMINMKYGRDDETQADTIGVCLMVDAGYDPQGMLDVMRVLQSLGSSSSQPEFFSTHPNPENRIRNIENAIQHPENCPKTGSTD